MKKLLLGPLFFVMLSVALIIIQGCSDKHRQSEFRGVWLHPGVFNQNRDKALVQMDSLFRIYQEIGINNLFCYNAGPDEKGFGWDYLGALIKAGHAKGLKIHPVFYPGYDINPDEELARHPSWLIYDMEGKVRPHFNIANPEVSTSHNVITKDLIIREVKITREEKTNGMVFFSGYSFNKEMQDTLRVSLF
jgi:uncharacterized lipoprotein YddW (UPF0748 family)